MSAYKALIFAAAICGFNLFSQEEEIFNQGCPIEPNQIMNSYNAPARYDIKGDWDFYFTGSCILWQAVEQGLDLGYTLPNDPAGNAAKIVHMDFDYKPGFKITLGSNLGMDDWTGNLDYTFLHRTQHSARSRVSTDPFQFYTLHDMASLGALVHPDKLSANWELDFDMLDLAVGRSFYYGTQLTFYPFFGLKGGWIKQEFTNNIYASSGSKYVVQEEETTWLLGPRVGFSGNWMLDEGFRFFGNLAASLFYQSFQLSAKEYLDPLSTYLVNFPKHEKGYVNADWELGVGFAWGIYCWQDRLHIDISTAYDFQVLFNQNLLTSLEEEIANLSSPEAGDLMLHGFTFSFRLDF